MFHEVRFPASLSFGSLGGPQRRTDVVTLANGFEERNTPWAHSRRYYDAGLGLRSLDDVADLIAFFEARSGQLHGFRWKDWADYRSSRPTEDPSDTDHEIGIGDSAQVSFQLIKRYTSGAQSYARPITKPVDGTVKVSIEEVAMIETIDFEVDHATGVVTFDQPPEDGARIKAGFEFDVPVRFDTDRIETSVESFRAGNVPNVPIVEIRV